MFTTNLSVTVASNLALIIYDQSRLLPDGRIWFQLKLLIAGSLIIPKCSFKKSNFYRDRTIAGVSLQPKFYLLWRHAAAMIYAPNKASRQPPSTRLPRSMREWYTEYSWESVTVTLWLQGLFLCVQPYFKVCMLGCFHPLASTTFFLTY